MESMEWCSLVLLGSSGLFCSSILAAATCEARGKVCLYIRRQVEGGRGRGRLSHSPPRSPSPRGPTVDAIKKSWNLAVPSIWNTSCRGWMATFNTLQTVNFEPAKLPSQYVADSAPA